MPASLICKLIAFQISALVFQPIITFPQFHIAVSHRGFTLAEVILSAGLAATALLSLVSLMAEGLASVSHSAATTTSALIARALTAEIQSADWQIGPNYAATMLPAILTDQLYFFDDQGTRLASGNDPGVHYTAKIEWEPGGVLLPGALVHLDSASPRNPFSRRVSIHIASGTPRDSAFFDEAANTRFIQTSHTVLTSRMPPLFSE